MFEVMNVDRVTILLRDETTGELVPTMSRSRLGDTQPQQVPRSIADKVVQERVAVVSDNAPADAASRAVHRDAERAQRHVLAAHGLGRPGAGPALRGQRDRRQLLQRRRPPVPGRVQRAGGDRHQEQPLRRADPARGDWSGPTSSATSRPTSRPRSRSRTAPSGWAASGGRSPSSSATSAASPRWPSRWAPTPSRSS